MRRKSSCKLTIYDRVLVKISCEVTAPFPDRKFEGIFAISSELSPMASASFEVGRYAFLVSNA